MRTSKGFTLVALIMVVGVFMLILVAIGGLMINNIKITQERAQKNAELFIMENEITPTRMTCAGDSDKDGQGTCVIVLESGDKIKLLCPTDWFNVEMIGATACKEEIVILEFPTKQ